MLKLRNLTLVRRVYVKLLHLVTRLAYGADVLRRKPPDEGAASRIRRINSELEFGPGAWEGLFLDAAGDGVGAEGAAGVRGGRAGGAPFVLEDACPCLADAMDAVVGDSLTRCFTAEPPEPWNFLTRNIPPGRWVMSPFVTLLWVVGLWARYCVLLPVRVVTLVVGCVSFCVVYPLAGVVLRPVPGLRVFVRKWLLRYLASVFVASWSGYIRFHGKRPVRQANQIYVANHTSLVDVFVLVKDYNFSFIGQRHTGLAGALQDLLTTAQEHVWFDREEGRDRRAVQRLLGEHVADGAKEPMLVFPEGTCTTTEYCIMFKKGSFELGAKTYPIAIRYRKAFGDAFWNSSLTSFPRHLLDLMTSWSVVCDVYYLDPMEIAPGETTVQFANRVKRAICVRAGLIDVNWDGFLKRHPISPRFLEQRQKALAASIMRRLDGDVPRSWSTSALALDAKHERDGLRRRRRAEDVAAGSGIAAAAALAAPPWTPAGSKVGSAAMNGAATKGCTGQPHAGELTQPASAAAAVSAAAKNAARWVIGFGMLATATAVTAAFIPASWWEDAYAYFGR